MRTTAEHTARILLRVPEAAEALALGRSTIDELIDSGELKALRVGRAVRIPVAEIEAWVRRRAAGSGNEP